MPPLPRSALSVRSMYFRMLNPVTDTFSLPRLIASGRLDNPTGRESKVLPSHDAPGYRIVAASLGSRLDVYESVSAGVHGLALNSGDALVGRPSFIRYASTRARIGTT